MIGAEYIIDFLVKKDIKDIFFVEGSANAPIIVAAARNKNVNYFCPLHEQAGSFMIDGYFKATRKLSAMLATSGPGGQNLLNGVAACYYDSTPGIFITGQINSRFIKPNNLVRQWGFQENPIVPMAKPITKYARMVKKIGAIRYELELAYHLAISGRPGPVLLDIPMDIQRMEVPEDIYGYVASDIPCEQISKIPTVIEWLKEAKRPAILLGGGIWLANAVEKAKELAELLRRVPVFVTWNMIDYYQPKYYGGRIGTFGGDGRNFGIQNCDFLLAIGSRISGRITGGVEGSFARAAKKVIVDIDKHELNYQQTKGDLNIICDAYAFIEELTKQLEETNEFGDNISPAADTSWLDKVIGWRMKYRVVRDKYWQQKESVNPYVFVKVLSEHMKEGDILVHEAGGNAVVTSQAFEPKLDQRVFSNNGNSSLGYALPAAIGAALASGKKVNCITGDGGLNWNIQEFQTLKYHKLPVKVFIFGNKRFGITKAFRDTHFQSEYAGVDAEHGLSFPDFIAVGKAYGLKSIYINDHDELLDEIDFILDADYPIICYVNMDGFFDYHPKLGWGVPIEEQYPFLPRDEFRRNMLIEPWEGWEDPVYPGKVK